jgi:hypothetical protein
VQHNLTLDLPFKRSRVGNGVQPLYGCDIFPRKRSFPHILAASGWNSTSHKYLCEFIACGVARG